MPSAPSRLLIVQPWFTAIGHPAQSTLNTAVALGKDGQVAYLISREIKDRTFSGLRQRLKDCGSVTTFLVPGASIRTGTALSLVALLRMAILGRFRSILFLDAHLVLLALMWRWIAWLVSPRRLSVIYLMGPEKIADHPTARKVVLAFLSRPETRLYLRTEELADAWRKAFPGIPRAKIDALPSLELPDGDCSLDQPDIAGRLKFGVLGQVRPGKGIEWLVPLFDQHPHAGMLTVAGAFITQQHADALPMLQEYPHFINRFLSEHELTDLARSQHYLLMLYDNWDERMEAATLYLAAKVNRPVIARDAGWCGRMVKTYNCGLICKPGDESADFFLALPKPGEAAYLDLLAGLEKFREAHSGPAWRRQFIEKVIGN